MSPAAGRAGVSGESKVQSEGRDVRAGVWRAGTAATPVRVFLIVVGLVFLVEAVIMFGLARWMPAGSDSVFVSLVDATLLASLLAPAVWIVVVRPLRALFEQRGMLLSRLLDAQERERARVAHDLHDELGQQLTALLLHLRAGLHCEPPATPQQHIAAARQIASDSLESVRRLARGLAPMVLRDLGLRAAIERVCEDMSSASGLAIQRALEIPDVRLPPDVEISVYRIVQEALSNVARHAQATEAVVRLERSDGALRIRVEDNGCGLAARSEAASGGMGIQGMRERAELLSGTLRVESRSGGGTIVRVHLPRVFWPHETDARSDR